jgi:hypothetical protein
MSNAVENNGGEVQAEKLVLKYREPTGEVDKDGNAIYSKSIRLGEVSAARSKSSGKDFFLATDEAGNTYYISKSNKPKIGPRDPAYVLTVRPAGADDKTTHIICGLFKAVQENGVKVLKGKNSETGIKYGVYPEGNGQKQSSVRPATAADMM